MEDWRAKSSLSSNLHSCNSDYSSCIVLELSRERRLRHWRKTCHATTSNVHGSSHGTSSVVWRRCGEDAVDASCPVSGLCQLEESVYSVWRDDAKFGWLKSDDYERFSALRLLTRDLSHKLQVFGHWTVLLIWALQHVVPDGRQRCLFTGIDVTLYALFLLCP